MGFKVRVFEINPNGNNEITEGLACIRREDLRHLRIITRNGENIAFEENDGSFKPQPGYHVEVEERTTSGD